jgi:hypothetical protein
MILMMTMDKEEIKKMTKFFKILHQIHCRIKLNNPQSLPKEADEDLDQDESPKLHRSKTNSRVFGTDN